MKIAHINKAQLISSLTYNTKNVRIGGVHLHYEYNYRIVEENIMLLAIMNQKTRKIIFDREIKWDDKITYYEAEMYIEYVILGHL